MPHTHRDRNMIRKSRIAQGEIDNTVVGRTMNLFASDLRDIASSFSYRCVARRSIGVD